MKDKNLLASLAVFRELYNKDIDIYSIIASAEKTSFYAMRAAFYEIMRKRRTVINY